MASQDGQVSPRRLARSSTTPSRSAIDARKGVILAVKRSNGALEFEIGANEFLRELFAATVDAERMKTLRDGFLSLLQVGF